MKIKKVLVIFAILFIVALSLELITGPHIYKIVKEAMTTSQGYTTNLGQIMTEDEFNHLNVYSSYGVAPSDDVRANIELHRRAFIHLFNSGYVWMNYTNTITDSSGEIDSGSSNVPIKFKVKKIDGVWRIIDIYEAP